MIKDGLKSVTVSQFDMNNCRNDDGANADQMYFHIRQRIVTYTKCNSK